MKYPRVVSALVLMVVANAAFADTWIAFLSKRDGDKKSLYIIQPDGSNLVNLSKELGLDWHPQWSPDGSKVVFESLTPVGQGEIIVMNADGSNRVNATNGASSDRQPRWSPDGSQILWHGWPAGRPPAEIFVADSDGSNRRSLGRGIWPDWSPDSARIGFMLDGIPNTAFIMNADGTGRRKVPDGFPHAHTRFLSWSPDGTKVAFAERLPFGRRAGRGLTRNFVYVSNDDGTNVVELSKDLIDRDSYGAAWSPDGKNIAIAVGNDVRGVDLNIYTVHANGTDLVNLTEQHGLGQNFSPVWSPDGSQIVFQVDRGGNYEVYVMNADGSNPVNLTNHPAHDCCGYWYNGPLPPVASVSPQNKLMTTWGQMKHGNQ